jgi:hypothetical protein
VDEEDLACGDKLGGELIDPCDDRRCGDARPGEALSALGHREGAEASSRGLDELEDAFVVGILELGDPVAGERGLERHDRDVYPGRVQKCEPRSQIVRLELSRERPLSEDELVAVDAGRAVSPS